jgi:hypothetical protein
MWLFSNGLQYRQNGVEQEQGEAAKCHFDQQRQRGGRFSLKRHFFMCRRPPNWHIVSFDLSTRPKWESAAG